MRCHGQGTTRMIPPFDGRTSATKLPRSMSACGGFCQSLSELTQLCIGRSGAVLRGQTWNCPEEIPALQILSARQIAPDLLMQVRVFLRLSARFVTLPVGGVAGPIWARSGR